MTKVLVVHGSRHGATEGIAQRIGEVLRAQGLAAPVVSAENVTDEDVRDADAFVVGSAVYMGQWLKEPIQVPGALPDVAASQRGLAVQQWSVARLHAQQGPEWPSHLCYRAGAKSRKRGPQGDRGPRRVARRA